MIADGFYDAMFDPFFDSTTSTDFTLCGNWNGYNFDGFYAMADPQTYQITTWHSKPTTSWTTNEVLHWMCNEATNNKRNYEEIKLENFTDINGETFRDMTLDDFVNLTESYEDGELFYKSKEALIKSPHDDCTTNRNELHCIDVLPLLPDSIQQRPSSISPASTIEKPKKGRPPLPFHPNRRKSEKRIGKLWEFLRNLLLNKETCPSLIKWDNYQEGTFKFVQSEKVAKLWGDRKKNNQMNYEKFSRAMRYYYRSKVLQPVTGKRLVYRFGPAATGWRTDNPIL